MSKGGRLHREIKRQAREILLEKGFKENEISEEFKVRIGRRNLIVDMVGISVNGIVAIECGSVSDRDKLSILRSEFDEVIHLPYLDKTLVSEIEGYKREIRSQDRNIKELRKTIEKMRKIESERKQSQVVKVHKESETESHILGDDPVLDRIEEKVKFLISTLEKMVEEKEVEAEKEELR